MDRDSSELGARLAAQTHRLSLLFLHLAGRAVRSRVQAEDVIQETFLRALKDPAGPPPAEPGEAALHRYLARLLRNCVVDVARAARAARRSGSERPLARSDWSASGVAASRLIGPGPGPATRAGQAEEEAQLVRAWLALSAEHRRVIGLRQFEGLSAAAAGRRMGRSEAAVHSLYRRALLAWEAGSS